MSREELSFAVRVGRIAEYLGEKVQDSIDAEKLATDREYIYRLQDNWLKELLHQTVKDEDTIAQVYCQFSPESTPHLQPDEFSAGVCIENLGEWQYCEHNMSYIKDFNPDNTFLKWWYYESIRMKQGGFTRAYYDPYLGTEVITYSRPVFYKTGGKADKVLAVLGIDIDYNNFRLLMSQKLVNTIRSDIEYVRRDFEIMGDPEALSNQYINVDTFELISKENIMEEMVTRSGEMEEVLNLALRASRSDVNVLLQGETGVGKDFWAQFIHSKSSYSRGRLINVNCCSLAETLAESEFFGYGKGAFTGARGEGKPGYFEAARGGTILLNEIGDLSMNMQAKLLNVIQEKTITRIGETEPRAIDFRLIAATNKDLLEMVRMGTFREDLYYRLNVISIRIPPLKERRDDVFSLIHFFQLKNMEKYKVSKRLSASLLSKLLDYSWPGNIRELENLMERMFVTSDRMIIGIEDLPRELREGILYNGEKEDWIGADSPACEKRGEKSLKEILEETERDVFIKKYMELGSTYKVAKALGISQSQAAQKIRKYGRGKESE